MQVPLQSEAIVFPSADGPSPPEETAGLQKNLSSIQAIAYYLEMTLPLNDWSSHEYLRKVQELVDECNRMVQSLGHNCREITNHRIARETFGEGFSIGPDPVDCPSNAPDGLAIGINIDQGALHRHQLDTTPVVGQPKAEQVPHEITSSQDCGFRNRSARRELLLVEDNPADVKLVELLLEEIGIPFHLTIAGDGQEAMERLLDPEQPKPCLVLLDLNLPKISGFEILVRLQEEDRILVIPIAVLSGSPNESDMRRSRELGARAYLQKPADYNLAVQVEEEIRALMLQ